jgi:hypothetical protein
MGRTTEESAFDSRQGLDISLLHCFETGSGSMQPPIQLTPGALPSGLKRTGPKAMLPPPSNTEVKHAWSYTSTLPYVFIAWCLMRHRDSYIVAFQIIRLGLQISARFSVLKNQQLNVLTYYIDTAYYLIHTNRTLFCI